MPNNSIEKLKLTTGQRQDFSVNLRAGAIRELQKQGLLTGDQVQKILSNLKH